VRESWTTAVRSVAGAGACLALGLLAAAGGWAGAFGTTTRVSVDSLGGETVFKSYAGNLAPSGRHVAFASWANDLVTGDTNGSQDISHHDRQTGATTRVSVASGGIQVFGGNSEDPSISANGRRIAFTSVAAGLVPEDTGGGWDVFVHDRISVTTVCASVDANGVPVGALSLDPVISADGRCVAFTSSSSKLVPGDINNVTDIFVRDLLAGTTSLESVAQNGAQALGASFEPSLSASGGLVAFKSNASNLVPLDTNGATDIFVRDRDAGTIERVSVASGGAQAHGASEHPALSPDGRFVAFASAAPNLVPSDQNGLLDVFVHDRRLSVTVRVSLAADGSEAVGGDSGSFGVSVSAHARRVAFGSAALNLVPGDDNGKADVFLRIRNPEATLLLSDSPDGQPGTKASRWPAITPDGRHVLFESDAKNLVPDDTNFIADVFVRDLP